MTHKQRQNLLQFLDYDPGTPDNIWGDRSRKAMEAFQRDHGLSVTGTGSDTTDAALLDAVAHWEPDNGTPPGNNGTAPGNNGTDSGNNGTFWDEIEYFDRNEPYIACPCGKCGGFPVEPAERLMRNADAVRKHFGKPMIPTSTVRCAAHNASLKGSAANSLHMRGKAMDFGIPGVRAAIIVAYCWTLPEVHECYAIDESHVHMGVQKY